MSFANPSECVKVVFTHGILMPDSLGTRLRTLRKRRSMTQVDVAAAIGMSRTHITKVERGDHAPGREVLIALAQFFDVSLDWLASGEGQEAKGQATAATQQEALLLYAFRALPEGEARPLLELLLHRVRKPGS